MCIILRKINCYYVSLLQTTIWYHVNSNVSIDMFRHISIKLNHCPPQQMMRIHQPHTACQEHCQGYAGPKRMIITITIFTKTQLVILFSNMIYVRFFQSSLSSKGYFDAKYFLHCF